MNGRPWTQQELDTLSTLKSLGRTNAQIAAELGRSKPSVATIASRLGLSKERKHAAPLDPTVRYRLGLRMGSLRELDPATQELLVATASQHGTTVAGAVGVLLKTTSR